MTVSEVHADLCDLPHLALHDPLTRKQVVPLVACTSPAFTLHVDGGCFCCIFVMCDESHVSMHD